jgi:tetratricopeptide (TPR) repeat protein
MGAAYFNQKKYKESMEMFAKAIDILKDFLPESHPDMQLYKRNYEHVKKLVK